MPHTFHQQWHYAQIKNFIDFNFNLNSHLSMLPGYHYTIFPIAWLFGVSSVPSIRLITLFISIFSIIVFFIAPRYVSKNDSEAKTLQYILFPLLYPFFFVIYTDVLSLLLVTLGVYLTIIDTSWRWVDVMASWP